MTAVALIVCSLAGLGCDSMCEAYENDPPGEILTLRYHNDRATPMFLGMASPCAGTLRPFEISQPGQPPMTIYSMPCNTCETLQSKVAMECDTSCWTPLIRLEAGGSYDVPWDGRHWISEQMPDSCFEGDPLLLCSRHAEVQDGTYELSAYGYDTCADGCTCTPNTDGWCQLPGPGASLGTQLTATASFAYPPSAQHPAVDQIDLVFLP